MAEAQFCVNQNYTPSKFVDTTKVQVGLHEHAVLLVCGEWKRNTHKHNHVF